MFYCFPSEQTLEVSLTDWLCEALFISVANVAFVAFDVVVIAVVIVVVAVAVAVVAVVVIVIVVVAFLIDAAFKSSKMEAKAVQNV